MKFKNVEIINMSKAAEKIASAVRIEIGRRHGSHNPIDDLDGDLGKQANDLVAEASGLLADIPTEKLMATMAGMYYTNSEYLSEWLRERFSPANIGELTSLSIELSEGVNVAITKNIA